MSYRQTNRLLTDIGLGFAQKMTSLGYQVCKEMVTHAGASELECCDCGAGEGAADSYAVTVWEERSYPSAVPPLPVEPEPTSSAWVDVHEVHLTVATCWWQFEREVPLENDPREVQALALAKLRDLLADWISSCARNLERLTPQPLNVWLRGIRSVSSVNAAAGIDCRGWELTLLCW